ncbi:MAG: DMT family transporter [Mogibacterium sp.]|nr:DMT family transporter [Mogibacterium sp.]
MKKVVFLVSATAFLFATMEVALKLAGNSLDPLQMTFLRFLIGGLMLLPLAVDESRKSGYRLSRKDFGWLTLVGIVGIPVSMLCFQLAVQRCNAATAAALFCLNPLFTMVIAHIFTSEKMDRLKAAAFCIGLIAAFFMIRIWDMQEGNTTAGIILILTAAITFSAYSVMGKQSIARIGTFTQTSVSFIIGSLVLLLIMIPTGHPALEGVIANWKAVAYCGIVVTGLGYMFYFLAIRYSDATTGGVAFFIKPAIAPFLAVLVLHEEIYWNTIVGIVLLLTASAITLRDSLIKKKLSASDRSAEVD